jgi:hypothetical protein
MAGRAQAQQERVDLRRALLRRVQAGIEMPGAAISPEQVGRLQGTRGEVTMDEPCPVRAHEPRLELGEVGVVAPPDVIEEGHGAGR